LLPGCHSDSSSWVPRKASGHLCKEEQESEFSVEDTGGGVYTLLRARWLLSAHSFAHVSHPHTCTHKSLYVMNKKSTISVLPLEALHYKLMRAHNKLEIVVVIERLGDVLSKGVARTCRQSIVTRCRRNRTNANSSQHTTQRMDMCRSGQIQIHSHVHGHKHPHHTKAHRRYHVARSPNHICHQGLTT
jgi:hypothetical protein